MGKLLRVNKWDFFLPLNLLYSASTTSPRFYIVGTPLIKGGRCMTFQKSSYLGGGYQKFCSKGGITLKKELKGVATFFYFENKI